MGQLKQKTNIAVTEKFTFMTSTVYSRLLHSFN